MTSIQARCVMMAQIVGHGGLLFAIAATLTGRAVAQQPALVRSSVVDIECEEAPGEICSAPASAAHAGLAGMIWHLAVHPDYRRRGIGRRLLEEASRRAGEWQMRRLEAWTRDDTFVNDWYRAQGFQRIQSYWHVYLTSPEELTAIESRGPELRPVSVFAHYLGEDEAVYGRFERAHRCNRYDLILEL